MPVYKRYGSCLRTDSLRCNTDKGMGNRVGVDASGSLVRVVWICYAPKHGNGGVDLESRQAVKPECSGEDVVREASIAPPGKPVQLESKETPASLGQLNVCSEVTKVADTSVTERNASDEKAGSQVDTHCRSSSLPLLREATECPYQQTSHKVQWEEELTLRQFIDECPLWGIPKAFCFSLCGLCLGKIFCSVIDWKDLDAALQTVGFFVFRRVEHNNS